MRTESPVGRPPALGPEAVLGKCADSLGIFEPGWGTCPQETTGSDWPSGYHLKDPLVSS